MADDMDKKKRQGKNVHRMGQQQKTMENRHTQEKKTIDSTGIAHLRVSWVSIATIR